MTGDVVSLRPGHAVGNEAMARELRNFADRIEAGEMANPSAVVVMLIENHGVTGRLLLGEPVYRTELAGHFLEAATATNAREF